FDLLMQQHQQGVWLAHSQKFPEDVRVGIMGLGHLGLYAAQRFASMGYSVFGWARHRKDSTGFMCYAGKEELDDFLAHCDILINLLPLTELTQNILSTALFEQLPQGASLIHCGRGQHLVETDLLQAIDAGKIRLAILDVTHIEPLPHEHAFWGHPHILVTPHISSSAPMRSVIQQVIENHHRLQQGLALNNLVDGLQGY
ncbi:MAG: NAD(P)-dependent oxidoreductase, partial [Acinetobacter sp.]